MRVKGKFANDLLSPCFTKPLPRFLGASVHAFGFDKSIVSPSDLVLHIHLIGVCNVNTRWWIWRLIEYLLVEAGVIYGLTSCIMDNPFYV